MIAIIDYEAGNTGSVKKAFEYLGEECVVTSDTEKIMKADRIVFPGVGSFGEAMKNLNERSLAEPIKKAIGKSTPFLGICLGLQLLFEESEESSGVKGLGIFKGKCLRFKQGKIPQIGWNRINVNDKKFLDDGGFVYFVNSYYVKPDDKDIISATANYGIDFTSAIRKDYVFAVQFHPEKSGEYGLEILRRWLDAC